jgi:PAS domain S-box-containing protein/putative nucleotidyltransferase with HDIG domain
MSRKRRLRRPLDLAREPQPNAPGAAVFTERIIRGEATVERDQAGKVVAATGHFQDVTDQHATAAGVEAAAAQWSETFDAMEDSVALFDAEGRVVHCNAATVALTGREMADIVGRRCDEVFHRPDYSDCPRRRAFETGQVQTSIDEQGGKWLRITFTPQLDIAGHVRGGVEVVTDITQLREAERAAEERSHFLEELLEAIPVPVYYKDMTLHFAGHNQAYAAIAGRTRDEIIGSTVFDVRPPDLAERFDASDRELLVHPERTLEEEFELPVPAGASKHMVSHKAVFSDVAGQPSGIVGVLLDVTEIRRADLERASTAAQLQHTLRGAVAALSATTELRDPYTAGHQRRVAELACAMALALGWDEESTDLLRTAALLHDVGKIVVPAEILAKPGRLTEPEMQLIRQHPSAGARMVGPIGFAPEVAATILQHHERLDGSGYPSGLRGEEILPAARVLAVADVIEAMISHRPYRPARPFKAAVAEIEDGAGGRYEAAACQAAISLVREQGFTFSRYSPLL